MELKSLNKLFVYLFFFFFLSLFTIKISASEEQITDEIVESTHAGWVEKDGNWFYYDETNSLLTSQFIKGDFNDLYYLGIDGIKQIGFIEVNNELYYAENDGKIRMETGWLKINNKTYYLKEDGTLYRNEMINFENNKAYYLGIDGSVQDGEFVYNQERYFADSTTGTLTKAKESPESTEIVESDSPIKEPVLSTEEKREAGVIKNGDDLYYVNNNGEIKTDAGWIEWNNKKYYAGDGGKLFHNQFISFGPETMYYMNTDGSVYSGVFQYGDKLYYGKPDGKIQKNAGWIEWKNRKYFANEVGNLYHNQFINFGSEIAYYMNTDGSVYSGVFQYGDKLYYGKPDGKIQKNAGWIDWNNRKYYANEVGNLYHNQFINFGSEIAYYMNTDGSVYSGVFQYGDKLYYGKPDGKIQKNAGWIEWNNRKYYANEVGNLYHNQFINFGSEIAYYMNTDGSVYSGVFQYGDKLYYGKPDGKIQKNAGWIEWNNRKYYANEVGNLYHNQFINFGSEIAYYMNTDGSVYSGVFQYGDKLYYGKPDGKIQKNAGWIDWNNRKYYANEVGNLYHNQFINFGSEIAYYMNTDGSVYSGVFRYGDKLYYGKPDGKIQKNAGWIEWKNRRYYANAVGNLYHNQFISFGSETMYYMNTDGSVYSGVFQYGDKLFYGKPDGKIQKSAGWIYWNNKEYYANEIGNPYRNAFISFGPNTSYYMGNDGSKYIGWLNIENGTYFFRNDGIMVRGDQMLDRRNYYFDTVTGRCLSMHADIPYYNQKDVRWGNDIYGNYYFSGSGCVPTSVAMIFSFLLNRTILPTDMGDWAYKYGYFNDGFFGTIDAFLPAISKYYGIYCQGNLKLKQVTDALRQGKMIIAAMNPPTFTSYGTTHAIVLYGIDENNMVSVYDPYFTEHNRKYSIDLIFSEQSTNSEDCSAGGPFFAFG